MQFSNSTFTEKGFLKAISSAWPENIIWVKDKIHQNLLNGTVKLHTKPAN